MRRTPALVLFAAILAVPLALRGARARNGHAAVSADTQVERQILTHGGRERSYLLRVPPGLARGEGPVPLVLVLHGGGGNGPNAERMTGFTRKAMDEGFIVAYPEGTGRRSDALLTWNAGHCCGLAMEDGVDDVGFVDALISHVGARYPVDPDRIFVTGMSNGGMMAHRLGRELTHRPAAIAPVVATLFGDEAAPRDPVSALMVNGMLDASVPYQGGPPGGRFPGAWDGTVALPTKAQASYWAQAAGCAGPPTESDGGGFLLTRYACPGGLEVALVLVKDGGHAWPGGRAGSRLGDEPSTALDATDLIWTFFRDHPRARGR